MAITVKIKMTSNKAVCEKNLDDVAVKVLTMWGMTGESSAKRLCPVDTGLLRNSITYALAGEAAAQSTYKADNGEKFGSYKGQAPNDTGGLRHVYIGSNVEYAPYQELGTAKMRAQPFLGPAIEQNKSYFRDILENELKKVLPS